MLREAYLVIKPTAIGVSEADYDILVHRLKEAPNASDRPARTCGFA
jgi:hypothetical protein